MLQVVGVELHTGRRQSLGGVRQMCPAAEGVPQRDPQLGGGLGLLRVGEQLTDRRLGAVLPPAPRQVAEVLRP